MTEKQLKRFWLKVKKGSTPNSCWEWTGCRGHFGYGRLFRDSYAHRVSWEIHFGKIPKGLCVLHKCDNPPCVNPKHLWLGTMTDNIQDRDKKRRGVWLPRPQFRGENSPVAKLSNKNVLKIRTLYVSGYRNKTALSKLFGVSDVQIGRIVRNKSWEHLTVDK